MRLSSCLEDEETNWAAFCQSYPNSWTCYIDREWWKYKENFVKHYTDKHMHYDTLVTSRVEGNHALLKKQLRNGKRSSIEELIHACGDHIQHQYSQVALHDRMEATRAPVWVIQDTLVNELQGKISSYALGKIQSQVIEARQAFTDPVHPLHTRTCSGVFSKTQGLPCSHKCLSALRSVGGKLSADNFSPRWHLGMLEEVIPMTGIQYPTAPAITVKKKSKNAKRMTSSNRRRTTASTGRILSTFERENFAQEKN